jgi:hypothetical protein
MCERVLVAYKSYASTWEAEAGGAPGFVVVVLRQDLAM